MPRCISPETAKSKYITLRVLFQNARVVVHGLHVVIPTKERPPCKRSSLDSLNEELEAEFEEAARDGKFSGAAMVAKGGVVLAEIAKGYADRDKQIFNTVDTKFRVASMNKMFTAVAIAQLFEQNKLTYADTLQRHVPDYPNRDLAQRVTIDQLLTHMGGTGDIFGPDFDLHRDELRVLSDYVELYGSRPVAYEPGAKLSYSNYGYILLGFIIEKISGVTFYDYVEENIFVPAGMSGSGFLPEDVEVPGRSIGYTATTEGNLKPNVQTLPFRGTSAGGGYSTVSDLIRFADALTSHRLLSEKNTKFLLQPKVPFPNPNVPFGAAREYAYGFGVGHVEDEHWFGHAGGAPGMNGELIVLPESGYVIAVLCNIDRPSASDAALFILRKLSRNAAKDEAQ